MKADKVVDVSSARKSVAKYEAIWERSKDDPGACAWLAWALSCLIRAIEKEDVGAACARTGVCNSSVASPEVFSLCERVILLTGTTLAASANDLGILQYRYAAMHKLQRHAEALEICKQILAIEPSNYRAQWGLANSLYHLMRYGEAGEAFERAWELKKVTATSLEWAHKAYGIANDSANERRVAELGRQHFPKDNYFQRQDYNRLLKDGAFEQALQIARANAAANPQDFAPCVAEGRALLKLGLVEDAAAAFREAIRRAPQSCGGYDGLLLTLSTDAAPDQVRRVIDAALSAGDFGGVSFTNLAITALELGHPEESLRIVDRLCAANPGSDGVHAQLRAKALTIMGHVGDAVKEYVKAADVLEQALDRCASELPPDQFDETFALLANSMIETFVAAGRTKRVEECLRSIEATDPLKAQALRQRFGTQHSNE